MFSRRSFLTHSGLGLALAVPRDAEPQQEAARAGQAPAAIAALTSVRDEAKPITNDERRGRLEKAKRLLAEHKMSAMLLTGGTSLVYFTGMRWGTSERLFGLVLPAKGTPFVVCPAFEEERAREQVERGPFDAKVDLRTWHEHESPYALVAQGLRERGIATGRLGIEETVRFVFSDGVAKAAPALTLTSATPVTAGCRASKDDHEIALMRLASEVTLRALEATYRAVKPGMPHTVVGEYMSAAHRRQGFEGGASVIGVGPFSAMPHGTIRPQTLQDGTILLIDAACVVEGYQSDLTRTFVLGKPTDKMRRVFDVERRAQDAALAAARPGVACEAVDAAARKVIVDAGFGPDYRYFTHRVGHGIGMDGHEWPYLVRGNTLPLAPGMTFSDEPGIYLRGEFGVRLEDVMVITKGGAELLTPQSKSLEEPFGE